MAKKQRRGLVLLLCIILIFSFASEAAAFGAGAKGPDVYAVQGMLTSLGYFQGDITGYYGSKTKRAVQLFQKAKGLPVTGAVDDKTMQSILWAYGNLFIPPKIPQAPQVPKPPSAPEKPTVPQLSEDEKTMLHLVNAARSKNGLKPLIVDLQLSRVARIKSKDMAENNYFSHTSPTYGSPFEMMEKFGISYTSAGENIACNRNVEAAHQALMDSPGHRENILNQKFTHIGIGIVDGGMCGKMFTQMFVGR